ncbi:metallophosphoesterase [cyanobacterium TDX16]|nr:metallophosphoesterase [cyanobacterium TDX16]
MLLFSGDPHGDFRPIIQAVETYSPAAAILLGDFDLERSLCEELEAIAAKTEIWFIPGNHDADRDEWYDNLFNSKLGDRNLHGRVVEIAGKRVAGLGGVFRGKIWMPPAAPKFPTQQDLLSTCSRGERWRDRIPRKHHASIFWQQYQALRSQRADILVTHEAPSSHRYGFRALDELAIAMGVKSIFHGHHHEHYSGSVGNGIVVHGVGEAGVVDEEGRVLVVGK